MAYKSIEGQIAWVFLDIYQKLDKDKLFNHLLISQHTVPSLSSDIIIFPPRVFIIDVATSFL